MEWAIFCRQICSQHGGAITARFRWKKAEQLLKYRYQSSLVDEVENTGVMQLQQDASSQGINDNEIIIVEDSSATSEIMVQKFEKITKSIHVYPNGDQLLRKLKLFPDMLKLTKIIILDFEIPGTKKGGLDKQADFFLSGNRNSIVFFSEMLMRLVLLLD